MEHQESPKNPDEYLGKAKNIVFNYYNLDTAAPEDPEPITMDEIFVVWFSKTLQNWKALVSTTRPNGLYYEVTYNGDKKETYLDVYAKIGNTAIADEFYAAGMF